MGFVKKKKLVSFSECKVMVLCFSLSRGDGVLIYEQKLGNGIGLLFTLLIIKLMLLAVTSRCSVCPSGFRLFRYPIYPIANLKF